MALAARARFLSDVLEFILQQMWERLLERPMTAVVPEQQMPKYRLLRLNGS
jgi:hypothetical protein